MLEFLAGVFLQQQTKGLVFASITGLCWATLAIALRQASLYASTGTIVWIRMAVALVVLGIYYLVISPQKLQVLWQPYSGGVLAALGLSLNYFAYMRGLELTSASNAQIMIQIGPLSLLLMGIFYFHERPSRLQLFGFALAILGMMLFSWDQIILTWTQAEKYVHGNIWIIVAAIAWAFFAFLQKRQKRGWSAQQFNLFMYLICTLALSPLANFSEMKNWNFGVWMLMLACGLNTLIAYGCFAEAMQRAPASNVGVIIAANPLVTILLVTVLSSLGVSWVIPEPVAWLGFVGAFCVVSGVVLTVRKTTNRLAASVDHA